MHAAYQNTPVCWFLFYFLSKILHTYKIMSEKKVKYLFLVHICTLKFSVSQKFKVFVTTPYCFIFKYIYIFTLCHNDISFASQTRELNT